MTEMTINNKVRPSLNILQGAETPVYLLEKPFVVDRWTEGKFFREKKIHYWINLEKAHESQWINAKKVKYEIIKEKKDL